MRKRRFRQANYATEAEILSISSKAVREDLYVSTDSNKLFWIDHDGTPQLLASGGTGGANLSVGGITATTLDVQSDSGTNATLPSATGLNAGLLRASDKIQLDATETSTELDARDTANRNRSNHTGTQTASTISDFDTEVSNNSSVTANTAKVSADGSINTHSDVDTSGASTGDLLQYDGSDWVPYALPVEDGVWTPILIGETTTGTASYVRQEGRYRYLFGQLFLWGRLQLSYTTNPTGRIMVDFNDLSFRSENSSDGSGYADLRTIQADLLTTGLKPSSPTEDWRPLGQIVDDAIKFSVVDISSVTGTSNYEGSDLPSTGTSINVFFQANFAAVPV